ncbi:hypothetical protein [Dethiobacter alkaliphilus]|uniref:hypothetical protein n=1 Tax=Dethiobacter alkaliphilus TaxID=427926 RepID=UPI002225FFB1|nr:hypothetical protein [Dethiobacter alkaliphilus]MCW3490457.1 hypothetical protein [Dethiobacter alkaliphilus]
MEKALTYKGLALCNINTDAVFSVFNEALLRWIIAALTIATCKALTFFKVGALCFFKKKQRIHYHGL